jgi:3-oxoacyl-[acyl-carrier-protein] synthase-3
MTRYAKIAGWGAYVPERRVTNSELVERLGADENWILTRTGVLERRAAGPDETTSSMGIEAGCEALRVANVHPSDVDLLLFCSLTPDYPYCPPTGPMVQHAMGMTNAGAIDMNATCSGFLYALTLASHTIVAGGAQNILIIASETLSRVTNSKDPATSVLFGDGAGAVLLQATDQPGGLRSSILGADGSGWEHLIIRAGGSRRPATHETVEAGQHLIEMNGRAVYRFAVRIIPVILRKALDQAGIDFKDLNLLVPHQANNRILKEALREFNVPEGVLFQNLERYGNTSTASVPIALCEALQQRDGNPGRYVSMIGFGAGLTWASVIWEWQQ